MLQPLAILGPHGYLSLDRLAVEVQRHLFLAVLVQLDLDGGAVIEVFEDDVDVDGGGEEVRHGWEGGEKCACLVGVGRQRELSVRLPRCIVTACGLASWSWRTRLVWGGGWASREDARPQDMPRFRAGAGAGLGSPRTHTGAGTSTSTSTGTRRLAVTLLARMYSSKWKSTATLRHAESRLRHKWALAADSFKRERLLRFRGGWAKPMDPRHVSLRSQSGQALVADGTGIYAEFGKRPGSAGAVGVGVGVGGGRGRMCQNWNGQKATTEKKKGCM